MSANEESHESVPLMSVGVELHRDDDGRDLQADSSGSTANTSLTGAGQNVDLDLPASGAQDSIETFNGDIADVLSDQEGSVITSDAKTDAEEQNLTRIGEVLEILKRYNHRLFRKRKQKLDDLSSYKTPEDLDNILHLSIRHGYEKIYKYLCKTFTETLAIEKNSDGDTPLHLAVRMRSSEAVKIILKHSSPIADLNPKNDMDLTPLQMAVVNLDLDSLRILIEKGANVKVITSSNESLLHLACKSAMYFATDYIKQYCDRNFFNGARRELIGLLEATAIQDNFTDKICLLLIKHMSKECPEAFWTHGNVLHQLTLLNCGESLKYLAAYLPADQAEIIEERNVINFTPVQMAAKTLHYKALSALQAAGADVKILSASNETLLHIACTAIIKRDQSLNPCNVLSVIYDTENVCADFEVRSDIHGNVTSYDIRGDDYNERSREILVGYRRTLDEFKREHFPLLELIISCIRSSPSLFLQLDQEGQNGVLGHGCIAHYFALLDYAEGIRLILQTLSPERHREFVNNEGHLGFSPLILCAKYRNVEAGSAFLEGGAEPNCQTTPSLPHEFRREKGWTPLHYILEGVTEANLEKILPFLDELLGREADPTKEDSYDESALMYALRSRKHQASKEVVIIVLCLTYSINNLILNIFQVLIKLLGHADRSWLQIRDDAGLDIFRYACSTCDASSIEKLIVVGADLMGVRLNPGNHGLLPIEVALLDGNGNSLMLSSKMYQKSLTILNCREELF